ncbi:MAG: DNA (cytosine-5-)-methyltransferase [Rhizobiales bacterium]|nr:DNA (cytosine-5-)-methyltransferase [Hyphomicrobiales bacterium]|tara:strand:- start:1308 stop:2420 length:1113 start_codon:yes stop_codon:yes gene_type:complete
MLKGVSLFSNIGIGELSLPTRFKVIAANDIDQKRCLLYKRLHPTTKVIQGDISKQSIFNAIKEFDCDFLISTPPCQGMSNLGKMDKRDPRNHLIKYSIDFIKAKKPKFIFHENVPNQNKTPILHQGKEITISEFISKQLGKDYFIENKNIKMDNYGIPQMRKRSIFLLTRKDLSKQWNFPESKRTAPTLKALIGNLPSLDPIISDPNVSTEKIFPQFHRKLKKAIKVSEFHTPVSHPIRQIICMQQTPSGKSAFENENKFKPRRIDGKLISAFNTTYARMSWDKPCPTVTTHNRTISSHINVHPGRKIKTKTGIIYSDPRVLSMYELMLVMTIRSSWRLSSTDNTPFLRSVIGEGVPPEFVRQCFKSIPL